MLCYNDYKYIPSEIKKAVYVYTKKSPFGYELVCLGAQYIELFNELLSKYDWPIYCKLGQVGYPDLIEFKELYIDISGPLIDESIKSRYHRTDGPVKNNSVGTIYSLHGLLLSKDEFYKYKQLKLLKDLCHG
jgi:hypothetical protein